MKKLSLLLVLVITCSMMYGQRNNRTTAFNYLRNGELDKAKEYIDKTVEHSQTKEDARSWFYRGNVYLSIHMSEEPEYKSLDDNALEIALDSYIKAQEYDTRKEYYTDIITNLFLISEQFYNIGVESYNEAAYLKAMKAFEKSMEVTQQMGSLDTMAMFNVALTAEVAGEFEVARKYYRNLLEMEYYTPDIFMSMGRISMAEGDTIKALEHIKSGREMYPDDFNLLINEINVYLLSGEVEKAVDQLELAVEKDNTNPTIFFAVGVAYDQLKTEKPESEAEYFEKAEKAYEKAISLDPGYFDPTYNLGALYVNSAAVLIEEANKLPLDKDKEYNALIEKANEYLNKAMPSLERALDIQPDDFNSMVSLKEIYTRLNKLEKLQEMNQRIKEHQERN
jgi:tetratricopeptide (TPR) repeat protein